MQIAKNVGTITLAHFGRVLKFLGIILGAEEFRLLVKRFAKNAYTVNYVAFLKAIDEVQCYLDEHGMTNFSGVLFVLRFFLSFSLLFFYFIHSSKKYIK